MAGRFSEFEMRVPLSFDRFDKNCILAVRLADNLQDITPRQGTESKVALVVRGFLAHGGLADLVHSLFKCEAMFCIREVIETRQVWANHFVLALGVVHASVVGLLLLPLFQ